MNGRQKKAKKVKVGLKLGWKDILLYGFLFFFLLFLVMGLGGDLTASSTGSDISISKLVSDIKAKKVNEISVTDTKIDVKYKDGKVATSRKESGTSVFDILKNSNVDPNSVKIDVKDSDTANIWINIISSFLPVVLIIIFFYFIFRQARGAQENIFSFGSNKGKTFNKDFPKTTFSEVAGVDEAKQEMSEVVDFLKNPDKYRAMGARTPKGVLLVGPSGTGKTLLARAVAGEAQVPFISIAGSEFMEMLVGVGAARVRDLFATAKKSQPAIIFIDEVDAIGRQRGVGIMGGHDEREQTLNQILVEMDGFTPNEQLVVIAATNRPDILDSALVRPGRFDRRIILPLPDIEGRKSILSIHAKGKPFEKNVDWERVARRTVGYSGADLENMLNEAAILAARLGKKEIDMDDIEEAATKVKMGPEKRRMQSDEDKRITAYHESGHALVSYFMPHTDPVHRISIVSRGLSLGHTLIPPAQDRVHETKLRLQETIATMLGGRVAEEIVFTDMTTGASDDIEKATEVARAMVVEYGMSDLGPVNYNVDKDKMYGENTQISESLQAKIDAEVKKIMDKGYTDAQKVLKTNRAKLDSVAGVLLEKETLEGDEFDAIVKGKTIVKAKAPVKKISTKKA
ncbi:MAG TPA: ATP-dependent zinc metalloprotease FtsH [Patescibacteria group bacterium]|nr:ATP-dependent zinc metalloprotease FtsH [Patescibacteria group bacterium]